MTFCCPTSVTLPLCTWRGYSNSVKYNPGCKTNEAEVWSLKFGCKSGYQSACCTTDTENTAAYANCRWERPSQDCIKLENGKMPQCSSDYPYLSAVSPIGFGGEESCSSIGKLDHDTSNVALMRPWPLFMDQNILLQRRLDQFPISFVQSVQLVGSVTNTLIKWYFLAYCNGLRRPLPSRVRLRVWRTRLNSLYTHGGARVERTHTVVRGTTPRIYQIYVIPLPPLKRWRSLPRPFSLKMPLIRE